MYIPEKYNFSTAEAKKGTALMGISLGKYSFMDREAMDTYCKFYSETFKKTILLIFDIPKRYNIMTLDDVSEEEASRRITIASSELYNFLIKRTKNYSNIEIKFYRDFMNEEYQKNFKLLQNEYGINQEFTTDCNTIVKDFLQLDNNKARLDAQQLSAEEAINKAVMFLLDEVALICCAPKQIEGQVYWTYPGINSIVENIYTNKYTFANKMITATNRTITEIYTKKMEYDKHATL